MTRLTARSLTKDIDQFLVFKRALGYPYRRGEATLRSFQRFACQKLGRNATIDLATTIKVWLSRYRASIWMVGSRQSRWEGITRLHDHAVVDCRWQVLRSVL